MAKEYFITPDHARTERLRAALRELNAKRIALPSGPEPAKGGLIERPVSDGDS